MSDRWRIDGLLKLGLRTKNLKLFEKNFQIEKQEIYVTIVVGVLIRLIKMKIIQYQKVKKLFHVLYSWFTYVTNISKCKKEHR